MFLCAEPLKFLSLCSKEHEETEVGWRVPQAYCTSPFVLFFLWPSSEPPSSSEVGTHGPPTAGPQARLSQEPPCCVPLGWQHQGGPELPLSQGPSHRYLCALSPNAPSLGSNLLEVGSTVRGFLLVVFLFLFVVSFIVSHLRTPSRRENSFPKIIVTADYVSLPCPSI